MFFRWWRDRRRKRQRSQALPDVWRDALRRNLRVYGQLTDPERSKLEGDLQILVAEKNWEGCRGFEVTDEVRVTVAAQVCLMVIEVRPEVFIDHVPSIHISPTANVADAVQITRAGVVSNGGQARLGEAWWRGPVILSWQ